MKYCKTILYTLCLYIFTYVMMTSAHCFLYVHPHSTNTFNLNHTDWNTCTPIEVNHNNILGTNLITSNIEKYNHSLHVSFLDSVTTRVLTHLNTNKLKNILGIPPSDCIATSYDEHDTKPCSEKYAKTINSLVKLFSSNNAAVISTPANCYETLAKTTYNSLKMTILQNGILNGIQNMVHYRTTELISPSNISAIIRDMKLQEISLVILLTNNAVTSYFFDMAKRFNIASYSCVWLTVELPDHLIRIEQIPWQIINIKQSQDVIWEESQLNESVHLFLDTYNKFHQNDTIDSSEKLLQLKQSLNNRLLKIQCKNENQQINIYARNSTNAASLNWVNIFKSTDGQDISVVTDASLLVRMLRVSSTLTKLRVVTVIEPPFTMYASHLYNPINQDCDHGTLCRRAVTGWHDMSPDRWEYTCCIGMAMDLLKVVAFDLHFYTDIYIVEDGFYGGYNKNTSQWNGLIEDIRSNAADIAVAALTPTEARSEIVDFCEPYLRIDLGVMISTLTSDLDFINWEFLSPLDTDLRIWIIVTFIIGTILIYLLENQYLALQRILVKGVHPRYSWREGFSYFSGLTFQRDLGGKNPQKAGARVTAVAFAFGMVIIMTTYTAVLTASKVSQESTNPFFGFKDDRIRLPTPEFKYATVSHTSIEAYFKNSQDEFHKRMYHFMSQYNVNQTTDGIELVKAGQLQAFIHEYPVLEHHMSKEGGCNLKIYGDPIPQGGYAFSVRKNSPWKQLISQSILKNKENEVIKNIYDKWFPTACAQNSTTTAGFESVEINYFGGLIFILGLSILISLGLLGLEHFCHRHHRRVINPIQDKVLVWRETKAAGRRNALIDPDDISRLQQIQESKINENSDDKSDSEDSIISEREEELIRMRIMATRRQSRSHNISGTDTTSINTRTSSDGSLSAFHFFNHAAAQSTSERLNRRNSMVRKPSVKGIMLMTTLEVSEPEVSETNVGYEYNGDVLHEQVEEEEANSLVLTHNEQHDNIIETWSISSPMKSLTKEIFVNAEMNSSRKVSRDGEKVDTNPIDSEISHTHTEHNAFTASREPDPYDAEDEQTNSNGHNGNESFNSTSDVSDSSYNTLSNNNDPRESDIQHTSINNNKFSPDKRPSVGSISSITLPNIDAKSDDIEENSIGLRERLKQNTSPLREVIVQKDETNESQTNKAVVKSNNNVKTSNGDLYTQKTNGVNKHPNTTKNGVIIHIDKNEANGFVHENEPNGFVHINGNLQKDEIV